MIGVPERTWRRWQAKARGHAPPKGPWPKPVRQKAKPAIVKHAAAHTAWGHRKVRAMTRRNGVQVSAWTVMRALRDENMLQSADYQRQRRQLAAARKAAFLVPPSGPNQVWQMDFWRLRDHRRWDLADRWLPGLLEQIRITVSYLADGESVRCDRSRRTRPRRLRDAVRAPARRSMSDRPGHR